MDSALCHVFAMPLGAALFALITWPFLRSWLNRKLLRFRHVGILWLDQESRERLRHCAKPVKLRNMEPVTIEKYLDRKPFENPETKPTRLQIETWPLQARLICDGKFDELRERQAGWIADPLYETGDDEISDLDYEQSAPPFPSKVDLIWLALILALTAVSIASYVISRSLGCPVKVVEIEEVEVPVFFPVIEYRDKFEPRKLDLLSDQLFAYREAELLPAQRGRALSSIDNYFSNFDDVSISRIEGFTDPIGTLCSNADLAAKRAVSVKKLLDEYGKNHPGTISFTADLQVRGSGPNPGQEDVEMWKACAAAPELAQRPGGLPPFKQSSRACAPPNPALSQIYRDALTPTALTDLRRVSEAAAMSRAQHQLTNCVSPMRRVTISFSGTLKSKSADQRNATVEEISDAKGN